MPVSQATRYRAEWPDEWKPVPWWVFWHTLSGRRWYRREYAYGEDCPGWEIVYRYATDAEALRQTLEENFGQA